MRISLAVRTSATRPVRLRVAVSNFTQLTINTYATQLRMAIEKGKISADIDAETTAFVIVGMLRGTAMQYLLDPERFPMEKITSTMLDSVRRMLGATSPPAPPSPVNIRRVQLASQIASS